MVDFFKKIFIPLLSILPIHTGTALQFLAIIHLQFHGKILHKL